MVADSDMVPCPYCAESIQPAARKCRYCGEWLNRPESAQRPATVASIVAGISVVSSVVGLLTNFTHDDFSLVQLLVEIGTFGFAMYLALIPTVAILAGVLHLVPELEANESGQVVGVLILGLLIAAAIRFGLFADDLTTDLDAFGTFFSALVGIVVVVAGLYVIGRLRGATADESGA